MQREQSTQFNQVNRMQALINSWNELSRSYELIVMVLELNPDGNWSPVDVRYSTDLKTGGVYQLRQGQSRQISLCLREVASESVLSYNGILFTHKPHKIEQISIGCIECQDLITSTLDSYQEHDLNRLREKCRSMLDQRKHYLYSKLKQLSEFKKDENKEIYESIYKQLADIGEEQAALDAPSDDSHLPGATLKWNPAQGMEEHVPIVFMDLFEDDLNAKISKDYTDSFKSASCKSEDKDDEFNGRERLQIYSHNSQNIKNLETKSVVTIGEENYLKFEKKDGQSSAYLDLKIISWNDSSAVEVQDAFENAYIDDLAKKLENGREIILRATARWDSSEHKSKYLNKETPLDARVYLIIKVKVRFKLDCINSNNKKKNESEYKYIDVVFRKRICVCVNSGQTTPSGFLNTTTKSITPIKLINLNKLKSILATSGIAKQSTNSSLNLTFWTGVTYRIIASIPSLICESNNTENSEIKVDVQNVYQDISNVSFQSNRFEEADTPNLIEEINISQNSEIPTNSPNNQSRNNQAHLLVTSHKEKIKESSFNNVLELPKIKSNSNFCLTEPLEIINDEREPKLENLEIQISMKEKNEKKKMIETEISNKDQEFNRAESNLSIASTLTNSSTRQIKNNIAGDETVPEWIRKDAFVIVTTNSVMNKRGQIRFVGETKFGRGIWVGVELEQEAGKNDGSVKGHRYFKCPDNKGVFVRIDKLSLIDE